MERIHRDNAIRIGYAIEPPFAFLTIMGQVTGETAETAKAIVKRLGIQKIEWQQTEFGALIDGLNAGLFDVAAASMFITRERAERVSFSEPTLHLPQGLLVHKNNPMVFIPTRTCTVPRLWLSFLKALSKGNCSAA